MGLLEAARLLNSPLIEILLYRILLLQPPVAHGHLLGVVLEVDLFVHVGLGPIYLQTIPIIHHLLLIIVV